MPDHCRISSEIRTSFGDLEIADLALVFDRLGVLNLLTPIVNLSIRFRTDAVELAGVVMQSSQKSSLKTPAASAGPLLDSPEKLLPTKEAEVSKALEIFAALLIPDLNYYIGEKKKGTGYYDYKSAFKSADEYAGLLQEMQRSYAKAIVKHPEESFGRILAAQLSA